MQKDIIKEMLNKLEQNAEFQNLDENAKTLFYKQINQLRSQKLSILITGATGVGKSSTINALFKTDKAIVGTSPNPETMEIAKYELDGIVLYDSPGLGDGKEKDNKHKKKIVDLLFKKDDKGDLVIDLVLVLIDGSSRDLGTTYQLINNVIIPSLGEDKSRLLVAINKADVAMSNNAWDYVNNKPKEKLVNFLNEKVESTKKRIKEATGVDVDVIYYSAGYQDDEEEQKPYNLSKLLYFIVQHTKEEKRIIIPQNLNDNEDMWKDDDKEREYIDKTKKSFLEAAVDFIGGAIRNTIESIPGGKVLTTIYDSVKSFFGF